MRALVLLLEAISARNADEPCHYNEVVSELIDRAAAERDALDDTQETA